MEQPAATQGQVYVSGWAKRVVTSPLVPRPLLVVIAKATAGLMRRRIHARDRRDAKQVPQPTGRRDAEGVVYFADVYHGGATFWDWVVLRGGGLWWHVLWPLVVTTTVERVQAHPELRAVLELDAHTYEELEARRRSDLAALRAVVATGRIEIADGTYAQPLAQTVSGEANIRHFFYGLDAIERVLGAAVRSFVAGEPQFFPQLPQLLAGFGITNVVFRTHWAPFGTDPAADADVVRWQAPDGSTVRTVPRYHVMDYRLALADHPGVQNAGITGSDFERWSDRDTEQFALAAAHAGIRRPLLTRLADPKPPESPFPRLVAAARNPNARLVTVREYLGHPHGDERLVTYTIDDIPNTIPWGFAGERLHRDQATAESALVTAERLDAILQAMGVPGQEAKLDAAWKLLLRAQHHDLHLCSAWHSTRHNLSMGEVGCECARRSAEQARGITTTALEALAEHCSTGTATDQAFLLFNPSPWPRCEFVQLPTHASGMEVWQRGTRLATQATTATEQGATVGFVVELPPLGVEVVEVRAVAGEPATRKEPAAPTPHEDLLAQELGAGLVTGGYLTVWKGGRDHRSIVERIQLEDDGPVFRRYRLDGRVADLPFSQWVTVITASQQVQLVTEIDFAGGQHFGPQLADHSSQRAYYIQDEKKLCLNFNTPSPRVFTDSPFLVVEPTSDRLTSLSFVGLEAPEGRGVVICHKGTPGWQVDRDAGIVRNVLAWGPERWLYASDDSITPGRSRYTAVGGRHRYEHTLAPIRTRLDAIRVAQDARVPVLAVGLPGGKGSRGVPWSFLSVAPEQVVLTALFARHGNVHARLWNASSEAVEAALVSRGASGVGVSFRLEQQTPSGWPRLRPWGIQTILLTAVSVGATGERNA